MKENDIEEARERLEKRLKDIWFSTTYSQEQEEKDLKILLLDYKRVLKENEKLKKDYYNVINKIENKIDRFDYKFEKAKRQNNKDKSDCYWNLIINFKELLGSEE